MEASKAKRKSKTLESEECRATTRNYVQVWYNKICTREDITWDFDVGVYAEDNMALTDKIRLNVIGMDKTISPSEFKVAVETYYRSCKYYKKKKEKNPDFLSKTKLHQRKMAKLKKRKATLQKCTLSPEVKAKIKKVLTIDYMSSEEDRSDDDGDHFETRPLRWRSVECDKQFDILDKKAFQMMSKRARRQTVVRKMGPFSCRQPPNITEHNSWAIRQT
ncbi:uncharacterized protein [Clytia hemisphaerica]|uniref:uncharacterized protein n=1 Tax=Clytia hemisphaerica TaxID=252671 RepID=UPI0034D4DEA8